MKIEEAIETLEEKRKYCKMFYELSANPQEDYPSTAKFMDALELALTALRSMPEAGEPLSLEQLKAMHGQWVWIVSPDADMTVSAWAYVGENQVFTYWEYKPDKLVGRVVYNICDYGDWLAYSYPPAHIDRRKWISVKNKKLLPKIKERVLSRLWYPDIGEVVVENQYYDNGMWMEETSAITHWMPLPEPPEEG